MRQRNILAVIATLALGLSALSAAAQDFPVKKPITLLVGFAAGGATDTAARVVAKKLSENIGQPVVVENKGGAGGCRMTRSKTWLRSPWA